MPTTATAAAARIPPGTRVQVKGFDSALRIVWEPAKIGRRMPYMLPIPEGYQPVTFGDGARLLVHQNRLRVVDNRP